VNGSKGRPVDHKYLTKKLRGYGVVSISRVVQVEPTRGEGWESEMDSWALIHFADISSVASIMSAQAANGGVLPIRGTKLDFKCFQTTPAQVRGSVTLR
jgi:hypothetical protein